METINYGGWPNCRRLSNGVVDLVVTTDIGPRVIRFGFEGERNEFKEYSEMLGRVGDAEWNIYGGHRLWHAPEAEPRSYYPDNATVEVEETNNGVRFVPPPEVSTGTQKEIELRLSPDAAKVEVVHRLTNISLWPIELAPWALSVMVPGGTAILPLPPRGSHPEHLLPTSTLTLWRFTDMADPRWTWGREYVLLHGDPDTTAPQKVGLHDSSGWCAYARDNNLFVKQFKYFESATYPDLGSSVEIFTNGAMLELETLGPLTKLEPGATIEHVEHWSLFRDVPTPSNDDEVNACVLPMVRK